MLKIVASALCALSVASAANAQDTVTWKDNVAGWNVSIDRTIDDSCFIISGFEDDLYLRFQFNAAKKNLQFIIASGRWDSVETGQDYELEVAFGDLEAWSGLAQGHRWNDILPSLILSVPLENRQASQFMKDFQQNQSVRISYDGSEIAHLALSGADEAIASMLDCQASMSQAQKSQDRKSDPFESEPEPI